MLLWSDSPGIYLQLKRWFLIRLVAVGDDSTRALEPQREKVLSMRHYSPMRRIGPCGLMGTVCLLTVTEAHWFMADMSPQN